MRTLQEKYNGINEGKFTKEQFLRDARMEQPNLVTRFNGYDDAVKILKNRGMIRETYSTEESFEDYSDDALTDMIINSSRFEGNEEVIARIKQELARRKGTIKETRLTNKSLTDYRYKPTNDMDKYPYEQILRGLRVELEGLNILGTPTPEEYKKALGKVLKNLEKDSIFYTNQVAGVKANAKRTDLMIDATPKNEVDKENGLKKAALKEAIKGVIKNILSEGNEFGEGEDVYEMYGEDEIDYDDENFSDPLIDGEEEDDISHPRGYEEASDEETFDDLFKEAAQKGSREVEDIIKLGQEYIATYTRLAKDAKTEESRKYREEELYGAQKGLVSALDNIAYNWREDERVTSIVRDFTDTWIKESLNKSEKELRAEWEKYQATCHPEDKMSYMEWRSEQGLDESISLKDIL
jgi:hypothetical protein